MLHNHGLVRLSNTAGSYVCVVVRFFFCKFIKKACKVHFGPLLNINSRIKACFSLTDPLGLGF